MNPSTHHPIPFLSSTVKGVSFALTLVFFLSASPGKASAESASTEVSADPATPDSSSSPLENRGNEKASESPANTTQDDSKSEGSSDGLQSKSSEDGENQGESEPSALAELDDELDGELGDEAWDEESWDEAEWDIDEGLEFELDTVVVTATRSERDLADAPATVSVVTAEELKKAPVGDLTDALRHTPGLTLSAGSQGRREINLRGMNSGHTLILIDGKRVNSREAVFRHNDFDIGQIPVESIERIEIVRGSVSALYGSEALGGVINIITKKTPDKWTAGIDIKGQTPTHGVDGEEARISGYAAGPLIKDRLGLRVTHSADLRRVWRGNPGRENPVLDNDGRMLYRDPEDRDSWVRQGELATLEGRRDHASSARLSWTPDKKQTISAEYARSEASRYGEYYIGGTLGNANSQITRDDVALSHEGKWDWGRSLVRSYWERTETNTDGLLQNNLVLEGNTAIVLGSHLLTVGAEARYTALDSPAEFTSGSASVHQEAVYAQNEWEIHRMLSLLVGARLDYHENFGFWPTPRGYLVFTPVSGLTVKGGVGTGFRSPTLRQMSTESIVASCRGRCYIVGNPDLEPETAVTYEASVGWNQRSYGLSAGFFQNEVSNLIDTPRGGDVAPTGNIDGIDVFVPKNVQRARMRGVEANAYYRLSKLLRLSGNYTFLDAWDVSAEKRADYTELSNRPTHSGNAQLDVNILSNLSIFGRGQYVGSQLSGDEIINAYMLFDAGISYKPVKNLNLSAGVLNIGNSRTFNSEGYPYQERGRTAYLGLNGQL